MSAIRPRHIRDAVSKRAFSITHEVRRAKKGAVLRESSSMRHCGIILCSVFTYSSKRNDDGQSSLTRLASRMLY